MTETKTTPAATKPLLPTVITARTAARFVGLSESTLAKLRLNGNGPVYCKLGRRVVYRPADLEHGSSPAPRATRQMPTRGS